MKKYLFLILFGFYLKNVKGQMYFAGSMFETYYDVNPDTLLNYKVTPYTHETYGLNLFDDSAYDIILTAHGAVSSSGSSAYLSVTSVNSNVYISFGRLDSVYVPSNAGWDVTKIAKPLIVTDPIDAPDAQWEKSTLYLTDHSGHGGGNKNVTDWIGTDKYLGIKYENGNSISYGWIRVKCPGEDSCYVKDFSTSQVVIDVNEIAESSIELFPNPSYSSFYVKNVGPSFDLSKFTLTDIFGQVVKFSYERRGSDVMIITDTDLQAGCYMLQCFSDHDIFTKKVVLTSE